MNDETQKSQETKHDTNEQLQISQSSILLGKKWRNLIIAGVVLLFILISFAVYTNVNDSNRDQNFSNQENTSAQEERIETPRRLADEKGRAIIPADCVGKSLTFTHDFVAPEDRQNITGVAGPGGVSVPTHIVPSDHGGTGMRDRTKAMPLYLPATAQLYTLNFERTDEGGSNGAMYFKVCGDASTGGISFNFGHLSEIAPEIAEKIGCSDRTSCRWGSMSGQQFEALEIPAGTIFAYVGGPNADNAAGFDIGVLDINKQIDLPGGFEVWGTHAHAQCPYTYFSDESTRNHYMNLLSLNYPREPRCGTMNLYVEGALAGLWLDPATDWPTDGQDEYKHVSFGESNASQNKDFFMNATINPNGGGYYAVQDSGQVNRAVKDITSDGNKYCIEQAYNHPNTISSEDLLTGVIVLQMTTPTNLTAEHFDYDSCPSDVNSLQFTGNAKKFERFKKDWKFTEGF